MEDSMKKFLAQNHELSRYYDKNSEKRKNLGFTHPTLSSPQEKALQLIKEMDESILHHQKLIPITDQSDGG
uniref:Uncharacterized protein n=1 Tax=Romanomermis culicivorax TaxID=13658 RepID=A0A915JM19_ROMCU